MNEFETMYEIHYMEKTDFQVSSPDIGLTEQKTITHSLNEAKVIASSIKKNKYIWSVWIEKKEIMFI